VRTVSFRECSTFFRWVAQTHQPTREGSHVAMTNFSGTEQQTHLADSVGAHVRAQAAAETFEVPF